MRISPVINVVAQIVELAAISAVADHKYYYFNSCLRTFDEG